MGRGRMRDSDKGLVVSFEDRCDLSECDRSSGRGRTELNNYEDVERKKA